MVMIANMFGCVFFFAEAFYVAETRLAQCPFARFIVAGVIAANLLITMLASAVGFFAPITNVVAVRVVGFVSIIAEFATAIGARPSAILAKPFRWSVASAAIGGGVGNRIGPNEAFAASFTVIDAIAAIVFTVHVVCVSFFYFSPTFGAFAHRDFFPGKCAFFYQWQLFVRHIKTLYVYMPCIARKANTTKRNAGESPLGSLPGVELRC